MRTDGRLSNTEGSDRSFLSLTGIPFRISTKFLFHSPNFPPRDIFPPVRRPTCLSPEVQFDWNMEISAARSHAAKIVPNATFATDSPLSHWEDPSLNLQSPSRMEKSSSTEAKPVGSCDVGQYPLAVLTDFRFPSAEPIEGRPRPMDRYSTAMGVSHQVKPPSCSQPLQPMQLYSVARSVAPTDPTANNGRRISALEDFEFQSGSPFDSLALKSLNDLEELKAVLQMPTITQSNGQ